MAWTNRGKKNVLDLIRGKTLPANFYVALVTSADTPDAKTNTLGDLTEIAAGNGYSAGGYELTPNATDFDSLVENNTDDRGELQIKDVVWTANGGPIPASGDGARWAVLLGPHATVGSREVWQYWSLASDRVVSDGQDLKLEDLEIRILEPWIGGVYRSDKPASGALRLAINRRDNDDES